MEKTRFNPGNILNAIEMEGSFHFVISVPPFPDDKYSPVKSEYIFSFMKGAMSLIYRDWFIDPPFGSGVQPSRKVQEIVQHALNDIFFEMLKNSMEHGNKSNPDTYATIGVWFGEKGIVFGFRDEGDFYSSSEVKEKLESRVGIISSRPPGGYGTSDLDEHAHQIFVNTEEKTLYVSYLF